MEVKVKHYFIAYVWPSNYKLDHLRIKNIFLQLLKVFYQAQPTSKQIICFDFEKQNSVLPKVFYTPDMTKLRPSNLFL